VFCGHVFTTYEASPGEVKGKGVGPVAETPQVLEKRVVLGRWPCIILLDTDARRDSGYDAMRVKTESDER